MRYVVTYIAPEHISDAPELMEDGVPKVVIEAAKRAYREMTKDGPPFNGARILVTEGEGS